MCCHDESVIAFQKPLGKFVTDAVCFFRRDLTGLKRLAYLIGNHIVLLRSAGVRVILTFGKQKFRIHDLRIALIGGYQITSSCFVWIEGIGRAVM